MEESGIADNADDLVGDAGLLGQAPRQLAAKKPSRPRTAIPDKGEIPQILSSDELEEVPLGSISGRLMDDEGNVIKDLER